MWTTLLQSPPMLLCYASLFASHTSTPNGSVSLPPLKAPITAPPHSPLPYSPQFHPSSPPWFPTPSQSPRTGHASDHNFLSGPSLTAQPHSSKIHTVAFARRLKSVCSQQYTGKPRVVAHLPALLATSRAPLQLPPTKLPAPLYTPHR